MLHRKGGGKKNKSGGRVNSLGHAEAEFDPGIETVIPTICSVCGQGEHEELVLVCDWPGCQNEIHMYCLRPPINVIPDGDWYCPCCDKVGSSLCLTRSLREYHDIAYYQSSSYNHFLSILQQQYYSFDDWASDARISHVKSEFSGLSFDRFIGKVIAVYSNVDGLYHYGRIIAQRFDNNRNTDQYLVQFKRYGNVFQQFSCL